MAIIRDESQQTTRTIYILEAGGNRKAAACVTCQIRPKRGMTISLDVLDGAAIEDEQMHDAVAEEIIQYMADEMAKAAALGVPLKVPVADE